MKNRKVIVTLEVETNLTVKQIKDSFLIDVARPHLDGHITIRQAQANLIKAPKATK